MEESARRTFVFISHIPKALQQSAEESELAEATTQQRLKRDPRFERLRKLLSDHTGGLMQVIHLEDENAPFGLALYASETEALAACQVFDTPAFASTGPRLRIILQQRAEAPEEVFTGVITVEGEAIPKEELVPTKGLQDVYRGRSAAKWCLHTAKGEDCPLGQECRRLHRRECQVTVKRRRTTEQSRSAGWNERTAARLDLARAWIPPSSRLTWGELAAASKKEENDDNDNERLSFALTRDDLTMLSSTSGSRDPFATAHAAAAAAFDERLNAFLQSKRHIWKSPLSSSSSFEEKDVFCFPSIPDLPRSAPWQWSLEDPSTRQERLIPLCPMPQNGAPTPLERDQLSERLLRALNTLNQIPMSASAIRTALQSSRRTQQAILEYLSLPLDASSTSSATALSLVLTPWLPIATVLHEFTLFVADQSIRCIQQRRDTVAYCDRSDGEQQSAVVNAVLNDFLSLFQSHLLSLQRSEQSSTTSASSAGGSRLLLSTASAAFRGIIVEERPASLEVQQGLKKESNATICSRHKVFLLDSVEDYDVAVDESVSFQGGQVEAATKPRWNLSKHHPYPLFSRNQLELLRK